MELFFWMVHPKGKASPEWNGLFCNALDKRRGLRLLHVFGCSFRHLASTSTPAVTDEAIRLQR
jgi:hypothetical protein